MSSSFTWLGNRIREIRFRYWKWNQAWDVNIFIRYHPAVRWLAKRAARTETWVLDVGSGSKGIAQFFKHERVVGIDLFSGQEEFERGIMPVCGEAFALPYADHAFDYVVCVDVLEHIPSAHREMVVRELLRVMCCGLILVVQPQNPAGSQTSEVSKTSEVWNRSTPQD